MQGYERTSDTIEAKRCTDRTPNRLIIRKIYLKSMRIHFPGIRPIATRSPGSKFECSKTLVLKKLDSLCYGDRGIDRKLAWKRGIIEVPRFLTTSPSRFLSTQPPTGCPPAAHRPPKGCQSLSNFIKYLSI